MNDITNVALENEMDLILAHKQSMRLADLTGLSISGQTTFATAVSEISRSVIGNNQEAHLKLLVSGKTDKHKFITAILQDNRKNFNPESDDGYLYAKRLVSNIVFNIVDGRNTIQLQYRLPHTTRIDDLILEKWRIQLNNDPDISPYEEIKRKNRELVEMANRLRESEQQYRVLTDSLPLMIMTLDDQGRLTYGNKWIYDYSGESIEELNSNAWSKLIHPDDYEHAWSTWRKKNKETDTIIIPDSRLRNSKTGEYRWHTGVIIAIMDEEGYAKCWNCFLVDIHAQRTIAETLEDNVTLRETKAELEDKIRLLNLSNQQLEQFAYVASHDLQEPLRKIGFYSDYLNNHFRTALPPEAAQFFENLIEASGRMRLLVQDILAYSTVRNEGFVDIDLNVLMDDILQELDFSIREKEAIIQVGRLPVIQGNRRQLMQLFENLISNSLKYLQAGTRPEINIAAVTESDNVIIAVKDNGIGFEPRFLGKMFDLFQRLHSRDKYSGTGIGLAICKRITDLHHGSIKATSTPGHGATFTVTLPLKQNPSFNVKQQDGAYITG